MENKNMTRTLIDKFDYSLEEIAAEVGCTANAVRAWYNGGENKIRRIYRRNLATLYKRVVGK